MEFPYNKLDIVFLKDYKKVSNSFPGGTIIIDESYFNESCDTLDKNYFKLQIINQM